MDIVNPCSVYEKGVILFEIMTAGDRLHYVWASDRDDAEDIFIAHRGAEPLRVLGSTLKERYTARDLSMKECPKRTTQSSRPPASRSRTEEERVRDFFFPKDTLPKGRPGGGGFLGIRRPKNPFR